MEKGVVKKLSMISQKPYDEKCFRLSTYSSIELLYSVKHYPRLSECHRLLTRPLTITGNTDAVSYIGYIWGALICRFGGDDEIRTHDLLLARQLLSQLSYIPIYLTWRLITPSDKTLLQNFVSVYETQSPLRESNPPIKYLAMIRAIMIHRADCRSF